MNIGVLSAGLNGMYADRVYEVPSKAVWVYGQHDWPAIRLALEGWEREGAVQILKDPEAAFPYEPCIRLLRFI